LPKRLIKRYASSIALLPKLQLRLAAALREAVRAGYGRAELRADLLAGVVVGLVALPRAMALAIASGVPPQHGIYTAIVGGGVIAALGGSRVQVSGPTAAFVVILAPIAVKYGLGGLCVATVLAGLMLIVMGAAGLGQLLQYVPHPVTTGFTAGIAVVIATLQLKDFFGLEVEHMPEHYTERVMALAHAAPTAHLPDLATGALTLVLLSVWPRFSKRIPAPLVALALAAAAAFALGHIVDGFEVNTIGSRFSTVRDGVMVAGIPRAPPLPAWPWLLPGPDGAPVGLSIALVRTLLPSAFAIAMLGAIESLLSATVSDAMAGTKHDPNAELVGQGVGNVIAPFFGGFAATGAIARTATNVRSGARSPIAAITHALFLLLAVLVLAPLVAYLPMASLAALLLVVAWNMSEAKHFVHTVRVAPRSDVVVLLSCFSLTVIFDMVIAVTAGVLLAALLFMRRMAEIAGARFVDGQSPHGHGELPPGVLLYEIAGPLFFGAAQKAMSALHGMGGNVRVLILDMTNVPAMDATGLVALESALARLKRDGVDVIIAGAQQQPREVLERAGVGDSARCAATTADAIRAAAA
jgi:SulP family sulfate permease